MKVFIITDKGWSYEDYEHMYINNGWEVTDNLFKADLLQFTGGEDVNPALYGEKVHPYTSINENRDIKEQRLFNLGIKEGIPMAGICRGGQFLNVMCGGQLWQHVDNHAISGVHTIYDEPTGDTIQTTSTHHQMMRIGEDGILVAHADERSSFKEMMAGDDIYTYEVDYMDDPGGVDVEVVYYPEQDVLCHQGHPEYLDKGHPGQRYYFRLLNDYLGLKA